MRNRLSALGLFLAAAATVYAGGEGRIIRQDGLPMLAIGGRPVVPLGTAMIRVWLDPSLTSPMLGETRRASETGIHLHVVETSRQGLPWPEKFRPREYVYLDRLVDAVLTRDLDGSILLRLNATFVPEDWANEHPEEMAVDTGGAPLGWPSLSSPIWRQGLEEEIRGLCQHIREAQYGKRIIGFILDGMHIGQWRYESLRAGDWSPAGLGDWRQWLRRRYGRVEQLREAWNDEGVSFETAAPPEGLAETEEEAAEEAMHLLDPSAPGVQRNIDYRLYSSERIEETAERVAGWFKAYSDGRLVGLSYGHAMELAPAEDFPALGHYCLSRLLSSPNVDLIVAPYSYDGRDPRSFGPHPPGPAEAIREAGKLVIFQDDTRTHLAEPGPLRYASNMPESLNLIRRNMGRAIVGAAGHWFFDAEGQGWLDTQPMWEAQAAMRTIYQKAIEGRTLSQASEAAIVVDEDSIPYMAESPDLALPLLADQRNDFARAGISCGWYLFSRLEEIPRSVKVFFFLNAFAVDAEKAARTRRFLEERRGVAVWLFAPGVVGAEGFSAEQASALTGIRLGVVKQCVPLAQRFADAGYPLRVSAYPILRYVAQYPPADLPPLGPMVFANPDQEGCLTLGRYEIADNMAGLAVKRMEGGWTSVFCALPRPGIGLIRGVSEYAGAHIWTQASDLAVHVGGSFLSVHCAKAGRYAFLLPEGATAVADLIRMASLPIDLTQGGRFWADLEAGQYSLFYVSRGGAKTAPTGGGPPS